MPNWCQNSIIIPLAHKKAFMRKFTRKKRLVHFLGPHHFLAEPIECHVDFNRILRMPVMPEVMRRKWLEKNWGTTYNAQESDFTSHKEDYCCELSGMFEVRFSTAWGPAGEKLLRHIANRLQCNIKHIFLEEAEGNFGAHSYLWMKPLEGGDKYLSVIKAEEEDRAGTYCEAVEAFYGESEYAEDLLDQYQEATC